MKNKKCNIASARAGNCFGGGDWTKDRIIKRLTLESFYNNKKLVMRNPNATRPWQHVLEPLTGYLLFSRKIMLKKKENYFLDLGILALVPDKI